MSEATIPSERRCNKCGQTFPATTEYFHQDQRRLLHGDTHALTTTCKKCRTAIAETCKHCGVFFRTSPKIRRIDFCSYACRVLHRLGGAGARHGRLTILGLDHERRTKDGSRCVLCRCDCGTACSVEAANVVSGHVKSCGCLREEYYAKQRRGGRYSPRWKGGKYTLRHGYIVLHRPEHVNAMSDGYVLEHIYVMAEFLGRRIRTESGEQIHHKNGQKHDNRLENLELWTKGQPAGQRVEDVLVWCKAYIAQYEADAETLKTIEPPLLQE